MTLDTGSYNEMQMCKNMLEELDLMSMPWNEPHKRTIVKEFLEHRISSLLLRDK